MNLFLTSQIGATIHQAGKRTAGKIDNTYGFLTLLKNCLPASRQMLYISSTPEDDEKVSDWFQNTIDSLKKEGIEFSRNILLNGRNSSAAEELVYQSDVIFLSGGHLPTQNQFFQQISLRNILLTFDGTIIAQSAGSMNCAETVYVCPELPGESVDPRFERFRPGLGLTNINIIPHYNHNRNLILDGKRFYEDIIYPDTFKLPIHLLSDGSFIHIHNGKSMFFGEIYIFHCGKFKRISDSIMTLPINSSARL